MRVLLAPSEVLARTVVAHVTVEAEYGATVVEGMLYTAAHHQPLGSSWAGRHIGGPMAAPCNDAHIPKVPDDGVILLSHFDLDSLGGALRALGESEIFRGSRWREFWDLAEFIDVRGSHKIPTWEGGQQVVRMWYGFQSWRKQHVCPPPTGALVDLTATVLDARAALEDLGTGHSNLLKDGDRLMTSQDALNERTFLALRGGDTPVVFREARGDGDACNHLYHTPAGVRALAIVTYHPQRGTITLSLDDPLPGVSCRAIVQELWGPLAGGHDGIAGSPRDYFMSASEAEWALQALIDRIEESANT